MSENILILSESRNSNGLGGTYQQFKASAACIDEDGRLRWLDASGYRPDPLADLVVSAQNDTAHAQEGNTVYGWEVEYHEPFRVNAYRAETMAKTLKSVERKLAKVEAQFGSPGSYASYVLRVAAALGIKTFVVLPNDRTFEGFRTLDPIAAEAWLRSREADFIESSKAVTA